MIETETATKYDKPRVVYAVEETCRESYNPGVVNTHSTIFSTENAAKKYLEDRFREIKKASEGCEANAGLIEGNHFEYSYTVRAGWNRDRLVLRERTGVIIKYTLYGEDENGN